MGLVYLLGILDFLTGVSLLGLRFSDLFMVPAIALSVLVIVKSAIYFADVASVADIVAASLAIAAAFGYYPLFMYAVVIWFLQKGVRSYV